MLAISLWIHNPHSGNCDNFLLTLTETIFKWTRIIIISGSTITWLALRSPRLLTLLASYKKHRMWVQNEQMEHKHRLMLRIGLQDRRPPKSRNKCWRCDTFVFIILKIFVVVVVVIVQENKTIPRKVVKNQCVYANCIFFGRLNDFWSGEFVLL